MVEGSPAPLGFYDLKRIKTLAHNGNRPLTVLMVHAHPDDECIGTGGTLARCAAEGVRTIVVYATRGELGEDHGRVLTTGSERAELAVRRVLELDEATRLLGVGRKAFLDYRDSGMAGEPTNDDPECFFQAPVEEAAARLADIIREERPHVVTSYDERGIYGHPDHVKCNIVTRAAVAAAGDAARYPAHGHAPWIVPQYLYQVVSRDRMRRLAEIFAERSERYRRSAELMGTPDELITHRIDVRDFVDLKYRALLRHASQVAEHGFFNSVPEELRPEVFGWEFFMLVWENGRFLREMPDYHPAG